MLQNQFTSNVVKETTFLFGVDSVKGFLQKYEIEPTHHVIFDEVICTKYSNRFTDSLIAMKENVASFWVAMGSQPITGNNLSICAVWIWEHQYITYLSTFLDINLEQKVDKKGHLLAHSTHECLYNTSISLILM
jgi:hypothetical protein